MGGTQDRPGLVAAVERAVNGDTGGMVSWRIDRFSRYTEGGLRGLRRLQERDARLAFVVEDIDTSGLMGRFVYTVMLAMGEYFLETIKAGWITAKSKAIARGAHIGPTPFGYERADDGTLTHLQQRVEAVEQAREQLQAVIADAEDAAVVVPDELWDDLTPAELGDVLRTTLTSVVVDRGRGPLGRRVAVLPKG